MAMNPRLLRPLASGFNPRQIAGLSGWWDAADASTLSLSGSDVAGWADKSALGQDLSQNVVAARPSYVASALNGLAGLSFSADFLPGVGGAPMLEPFSLFLVCKAVSPSGVPRVCGNGPRGIGPFAASNTQWGFFNAGGVKSFGPAAPTTSAGVLSMTCDASRAGVFFGNGVQGSTGTVIADDPTQFGYGFAVGANNAGGADRFTGEVYEVLGFSRALATSERQRVEGYLAWKWGLQAQLPYDHPYARSFPGFGSQATPTDADTLAYLAAVKAADGTGVEVGVANAVDAFVTGCKSDGIWDALDQCCILAGARTLAGALVPLRGSAPTNNNFVSGDYDREAGLQGDGINKNLVTAKSTDQFSSASFHACVYLHGITALGGYAIGGDQMLFLNQAANVLSRNLIANNLAFGSAATPPTFMGLSRVTLSRSIRVNGSTVTGAVSGESVGSNAIRVFSTATDGNFFNARMSFYSYGTLVDLSALDTRVSALINAIGAAI